MANSKNNQQLNDYLDTLRVGPGKKVTLKDDFSTKANKDIITKDEAADLLSESIEKLAELQEKLWAHNRQSVLIIIQAMDAAGKDSVIKHVYSGVNPQG